VGTRPRQHFEQHGAHGPKIRARIDRGVALRLFWGHVERCSNDLARARKNRARDVLEFRDPEVEELEPRGFRGWARGCSPQQKNVLRFDVAVHDAGAMRGFECVEKLDSHPTCRFDRQTSVREEARKWSSFEEFHHEEGIPLRGIPEIIYL
jgi:hypothetical protein